MGQQIIKQPDGFYSVFSSVVDNWIIINATDDELCEHYGDIARAKAIDDVRETIGKLEAGEKPYHQFTMSWDDANDLIRELHGSEAN